MNRMGLLIILSIRQTCLKLPCMKLFDSHCHLSAVAEALTGNQDEALAPTLGSVKRRAAAAGVVGLAVCGTSSRDWVDCIDTQKKVRGLEKSPTIFPMLGIHPWFVGGRGGSSSRPQSADREAVASWRSDFQWLEEILTDCTSIGIGETGLDFSSFAKAAVHKQDRFNHRAEQEASFRAHLKLATELNRPVTIHCVRAWGKMLEILHEFPEPKKILHAFGGAEELIPELAALNCYFSFCGNVTNPEFKRVRAAVASVPEDRLLVETDSPDFPPRGCCAPNEPANLICVVRAVAELRKTSVEKVARQTFLNAFCYTE